GNGSSAPPPPARVLEALYVSVFGRIVLGHLAMPFAPRYIASVRPSASLSSEASAALLVRGKAQQIVDKTLCRQGGGALRRAVAFYDFSSEFCQFRAGAILSFRFCGNKGSAEKALQFVNDLSRAIISHLNHGSGLLDRTVFIDELQQPHFSGAKYSALIEINSDAQRSFHSLSSLNTADKSS